MLQRQTQAADTDTRCRDGQRLPTDKTQATDTDTSYTDGQRLPTDDTGYNTCVYRERGRQSEGCFRSVPLL